MFKIKIGFLFFLIISSTFTVFSANLKIPISGNLFYKIDQKEINIKKPNLKNLNTIHDGIPTYSAQRKYWAVLTNPSSKRYTHGILGDTIEATSITVIKPSGEIVYKISLPNPEVIESRLVIWADTNGDKKEELTVTVSSRYKGASVRIYNGATGKELARGAEIGKGNRWQHVIGWASFGNLGKVLALVKTPHINGVLELYQRKQSNLIKVAEIKGVSSHKIGSRNLFLAAIVDSNFDGSPEIYLPDQSINNIVGIKFKNKRFTKFWQKKFRLKSKNSSFFLYLNKEYYLKMKNGKKIKLSFN